MAAGGSRRALRQIGSIAGAGAQVVGNVTSVGDTIAKALGGVIASIGNTVAPAISTALTAVITGAGNVIGPALGNALASVVTGATGAVASAIGGPVGDIIGKLGKVTGGGLQQVGAAVGRGLGATGRVVGAVVKRAPNIAGQAIGAAGGGLKLAGAAITAGLGQAGAALTSFAQLAQQFVQALSPATVKQFQIVMADLSATIGQALLPAFIVVTDIFRRAGGIISPLMQQLAPVIEQVIQIIGGVFLSGLRAVTTVIQALIPIIQFLLPIIDAVLQPLEAFRELLAVLTGALLSVIAAFGGWNILKSILTLFTDSLKLAVESLIVFVAYLAKLFGADKVVKDLKDQFTDKGASGIKASQPAQIKGLEQIAKDLNQAAFQAGPGGSTAADPQKEFRDRIAKSLDNIDSGRITFAGFLKDQFDRLITALVDAIRGTLGLAPAKQGDPGVLANSVHFQFGRGFVANDPTRTDNSGRLLPGRR